MTSLFSAQYKSGENKEVIIRHLLVRNYTALQSTATLVPTVGLNISELTPTVTETQNISATPFPTNSGSLEVTQIQSSLQWGGILGIASLFIIGFIALVRWLKYIR